MDATHLSTGSNPGNIKLKVYEGTNLRMEKTILDFPTGIAAIYIDNHVPKTPGNVSSFRFVIDFYCFLCQKKLFCWGGGGEEGVGLVSQIRVRVLLS